MIINVKSKGQEEHAKYIPMCNGEQDAISELLSDGSLDPEGRIKKQPSIKWSITTQERCAGLAYFASVSKSTEAVDSSITITLDLRKSLENPIQIN